MMLCCITYFIDRHFIEPSVNDLFLRLTMSQNPSEQIVNVAIDEDSISKIGRWPWNRELYGNLFEFIEKSGAKVIIFDSVITTPDKELSDKRFFKRLKSLDNIVLGMFFCNKEQNSSNKIEKFALNIKGSENLKIKPYEYYSNLPDELIQNADAMGSVLSIPDEDGVIRRLSPVFLHKGKYYPSIALKAVLSVKNNPVVSYYDNKLKLDNITIPLDEKGKAHLKWFKPISSENFTTHTTYSAADVLLSFEQQQKKQMPKISPDEFKDKIVIIGATAYALNDIKKTPVGIDYPGIEIQATFIDNIINNNFMHKTGMWINLLILVVLVFITVQSAKSLPIVYSLLMLITLMLSWIYAALKIYSSGYIIDVITPLSFILLFYSLTFVYKYFLTGKSKNNLQNVMSKYISKPVMKNVLENESADLGGKKAYISVLFADIRQFTSISEVYTPEEVSSLLNEYFSIIAPIIDKYNGTLNKFMGDAIMAIFGEPLKDENHARNAVLCANEILHEVKKLNYKWKISNKPEIRIGVAINTGSVFIGNIGSKDRMEFTVIGDTVNIASRIESLNRVYNTTFLISSSTYERVKDLVNTIKIRDVFIKGRASSITIHEVINIKNEQPSTKS